MIHLVASIFVGVPMVLVTGLWLAAEWRRASAERRIDALLGVIAKIHLHAQAGANNFDKAAGTVPQPAWLEPIFAEAQFGASRMRAIERTAEQVLQLTRGDQHGRERQQEERL